METLKSRITSQHGVVGLELALVNTISLARLLLSVADPEVWQKIVSSLYAIILLCLGYRIHLNLGHSPVGSTRSCQELATTFLGLAIPIAAGFFGSQALSHMK